MKKLVDRKYLNFPHLCLVEDVEKWRDRNLFCLVEMINEILENKVGINLPLCPC